MKRTLVTGLLLLGIVVGLNASAVSRQPAASNEGATRADESIGVLIYSAAWGLTPERYGLRRTPIAIIVNGAFRKGAPDEPGLRVIAIHNGQAEAMRSFDLAESEDDLRAFGAFCDSARPGTVLAMGVYYVASPRLDDQSGRRQRLEERFRALGAQRPPTEDPKASWAYLCVRDERGWRPIAEAQSTTRGIVLARTIGHDPLRTASLTPTVRIDRWDEISLIDRFTQASYVTEGFTEIRRPSNAVGGGPLDAIFAHPPYGERGRKLGFAENRLAWDGFAIPRNAMFQCQLGIRSYARPNSDGVVFQLLVNGVLIAEREHGTRPFDPDTWVPWSVDLARYGGQSVRLELRVGPVGKVDSDHALWGDPMIVFPNAGEDQPVGTDVSVAQVSVYFTRPEAGPSSSPPALGLARVISAARDEILLCMFRFNHDEVRDALIAAHKRGVTVRVLTDEDFWTTEYAPTYDTIQAAGIEVRTDRTSLDTVMHHKFAVIDSTAVWTGDWNAHTSDSFRSHHAALLIPNRDLAAIYSSAFESLWAGDPPATLARRHAESGHTVSDPGGATYAVYFTPGDSGIDVLREAIAMAKERVWMAHGYLNNRAVIAELIEARERGIDVRVLFQMPYINLDAAMAINGVDVRKSSRYLGCKFLAIDGRDLIIGSWNFGSQETDIENLLVIRDLPEVVAAFELYFNQIYEASEPYFTASASQLISGRSESPAMQELSFRPLFEDHFGQVALERLGITRTGEDERIEAVLLLNSPDAEYVVDYSLSAPMSKYGPVLDKRNAPVRLDTSAVRDGVVTAVFVFNKPAKKDALAIIRITRIDGPGRRIVAKYAARLDSLR
ncbi:MAG: hypothetical protein IID31_06930 [Planctomycetes bacterium]|nr:hypothetical protein [Planctomycetota bacterium]